MTPPDRQSYPPIPAGSSVPSPHLDRYPPESHESPSFHYSQWGSRSSLTQQPSHDHRREPPAPGHLTQAALPSGQPGIAMVKRQGGFCVR